MNNTKKDGLESRAGYIGQRNSYVQVNGQRIAYREAGAGASEIPLVMLTHLAATLDEWDPLLIDLLATNNHVVLLDLPGVGASSGAVPDTIEEMAIQAIDIIHALGYSSINLLGLSMGGMIAQEIVRADPTLVHRLILAGTAPRGGEGVEAVTRVTFGFMLRAALTRNDPKRYIFYGHDARGSREAKKVLGRMAQRRPENKDHAMTVPSFLRQLRAIHRWGKAPLDNMAHINQPTLIVNGDNDRQVPTANSPIMHSHIPGSRLVIYPNAGHGSIFQYVEEFAAELGRFLDGSPENPGSRSDA